MKKLLAIIAALTLLPLTAQAQTTKTVRVSGGTYTLTQFQTALNDAVCGDTIRIQTNQEVVGMFTLPVKNCQANPITVTTDVNANLPGAGVRTGPQYAQYMARIRSNTQGGQSLRVFNNTNGWVFRHIHFPPTPQGHGDIISMGGEFGVALVANEPHHITYDQIYIHGDPLHGQKVGIRLDANNIAVTNSYFDNFTGMGQDTMALISINGSGDFTITNNYLEASAYALMFGGGDPANRTHMTVTGSASTTGAAVQTDEAGHTLANLTAWIGRPIAVETTSGLRWPNLASVTGSGTTGSITWTPAIDIAPNVGQGIRRSNVPKNATISGNTIAKDPDWRNGIIPTPGSPSVSTTGTGTLAAGTYYYRIQSYNTGGFTGQTIYSDISPEVSGTLGAPGRITLTWGTLPSANGVRVWRCSTAGSTACSRRDITPYATSFVDDGSGTWTSATRPNTGSRWVIKNIFELKVGDTFNISGNIIEYNWISGGGGGEAMWMKSVNQSGACWGCYTQDIVIENNIIRHVASIMSMSSGEIPQGSGYYRPKPILNFTFRNNLVYDCGVQWHAGSSLGTRQFQLGGPTTNLLIEHNTMACESNVSPSNYFTFVDDNLTRGTNTNFIMRYNIGFKNSWGVWGLGGTGTASLNQHAPGYTFLENVVADASCGSYPATTYCPTGTTLKTYFVNYQNNEAGGNFNLTGTSPYDAQAADGSDLGADIAAIMTAVGGGGGGTSPPNITLTSMPNDERTSAYPAQTLTATSGTTPYTWSLFSGALPTGLSLSGNSITGTPTASGTFNFSIRVTDSTSPTALTDTQAYTVTIVDPVVITTTTLPSVAQGQPYSQTLAYTGGLTPVVWAISTGSLPTGLSLNTATGAITGTSTAVGTTNFTAQVTGAGGTVDTQALSIIILGDEPLPPGRPDFSGPLRQEIQTFRRTTAPTCTDRVAKGDKWIDISIAGTPVTHVAQTTCPSAITWVSEAATVTGNIDASQVTSGTLSEARLPSTISINGTFSANELHTNVYLGMDVAACSRLSTTGQVLLCVDTDGTLKHSTNGAAYTAVAGQDSGGGGGGTPSSVTPTFIWTVIGHSATALIGWPSAHNGSQEILNTQTRRARIDMTGGYTEYRLSVRMGTASNAGANMTLECSLDAADGVAGTWQSAGSGAASMATANTTAYSSWATLASACRADAFWRLVGTGGTNANTPSLGSVNVQFR